MSSILKLSTRRKYKNYLQFLYIYKRNRFMIFLEIADTIFDLVKILILNPYIIRSEFKTQKIFITLLPSENLKIYATGGILWILGLFWIENNGEIDWTKSTSDIKSEKMHIHSILVLRAGQISLIFSTQCIVSTMFIIVSAVYDSEMQNTVS
jgi:hypothetical protein